MASSSSSLSMRLRSSISRSHRMVWYCSALRGTLPSWDGVGVSPIAPIGVGPTPAPAVTINDQAGLHHVPMPVKPCFSAMARISGDLVWKVSRGSREAEIEEGGGRQGGKGERVLMHC